MNVVFYIHLYYCIILMKLFLKGLNGTNVDTWVSVRLLQWEMFAVVINIVYVNFLFLKAIIVSMTIIKQQMKVCFGKHFRTGG